MSSVIIDRRPDRGKSTGNRQRVLKRLEGALRAQVDQMIARRGLSDHDKSADMEIKRKDVKEPRSCWMPRPELTDARFRATPIIAWATKYRATRLKGRVKDREREGPNRRTCFVSR